MVYDDTVNLRHFSTTTTRDSIRCTQSSWHTPAGRPHLKASRLYIQTRASFYGEGSMGTGWVATRQTLHTRLLPVAVAADGDWNRRVRLSGRIKIAGEWFVCEVEAPPATNAWIYEHERKPTAWFVPFGLTDTISRLDGPAPTYVASPLVAA